MGLGLLHHNALAQPQEKRSESDATNKRYGCFFCLVGGATTGIERMTIYVQSLKVYAIIAYIIV